MAIVVDGNIETISEISASQQASQQQFIRQQNNNVYVFLVSVVMEKVGRRETPIKAYGAIDYPFDIGLP